MDKPITWAEALQAVPALNGDIIFIRTALRSLIESRSPEPGDEQALDQIADDAVYLSNRIFEKLGRQFITD